MKTPNKPQTPSVVDGSNMPMKIYVRKSHAEKLKQHAAEVFRLNREGVKFLKIGLITNSRFPKYDLVLIPEFPFGGMEHAGATFLREDRVISRPSRRKTITSHAPTSFFTKPRINGSATR